MNSRKVKEIVKFSIHKNLQSKWFIILNVLVLISTIIMTNMKNIDTLLKNNNINLFNDNIILEIIDTEKIAIEELKKEFKEDENIEIREVDTNNYTKENITDEIIVIEINKSNEDIIKATITSKEGIAGDISSRIEKILKEVRSNEFAKLFNVDNRMLDKLNEEIKIERKMLLVEADNYETKQMIKTISTLLIYVVSIFIFTKIANEIAQEKVSKSIEYILTSVTEKEYLLAKIISIISVVLLQGIYFFIYYVIGNAINNLIAINVISDEASGVDLFGVFENIDLEIVFYLVVVFVYGLLTLILMSIIQAALSSKTTNMSEAGNTTTFLMTVTILMYFITLMLITPYTNMNWFIYLISCIPLASNYFIPAILIIGQATTLQIVISLALLIISVPVSFKICSKIFKNGVLDYKPNQKTKNKKVKKERTLIEEQEHKFLIQKYKKFSFVIRYGTYYLDCLSKFS